MKKKIWPAFLCLIMIVSCFSGLVLASGGQENGLPSLHMSEPSDANIDMYSNTRIAVRVPFSGPVTLTGTVMAQGTESPTQHMDTAHVNALFQSITGTAGNNEKLLIGEVTNNSPLYARTISPTTALDVSATASAEYPYLAKEFAMVNNYVPRLWEVTSDGNYSFTLIPEVHTTKYYGFTLESLYGATGSVNSSAYGVFESLATPAGPDATITKTPSNRYIQNTPLTVRYMYKLANPAMTFPAGTSGNLTVSGTIVTADDKTIPHDFGYEVRAGSATGQLITSGRTQEGAFAFTMNSMLNTEVYLYPTERYGYVEGSGYQYIPLNTQISAEQFPYVVASPQRQVFFKAELNQTTINSETSAQPIKFAELYTYNETATYDVIAAAPTGFNAQPPQAYLYGVPYIVYNESGQALQKMYSINYSHNVTWSWGWTNSQAPTLIDSASITNTPSFRINGEGYLTFGGEVVSFDFASGGTASLRVRQTGRMNGGTVLEQAELYQSILNVNIEAPLYGDLDGNGAINGIDQLLMMDYFAKEGVIIDEAAADVNADGTLNGIDQLLFMDYFAKSGIVLGPR